MSDPFREPADGPTAIALARLGALPTHPLRRVGAALAAYREVAAAPARPDLVRAAESLGFVRLGCAAEGRIPYSFKKQIFVDKARTTQAHVSARYFLATYFESGRCILTWDHAPAVASTERLLSRPTAGSFAADYAAHAHEVAAWSATDAPLAVEDLAVAVALGRHYYRQVASLPSTASMILSPVVVVAGVGWALWMLLHGAR